MLYLRGLDLGGGCRKWGDGMDGFCLSFEDISLIIIAKELGTISLFYYCSRIFGISQRLNF